MGFIGALTVTIKKAWHPKLFVLTGPLVFETDDLRVEVPAGFETDLASIPWFGRWIFTRAHSNAYAAVVHDYLYDTGLTHRRLADAAFFEALKDPVCNTNVVSRWVMWAGVRAWGWRGWRRARNADQHFKVTEMPSHNMPSLEGQEGEKEDNMRHFRRYERFEKPRRKVHTVFVHCSASDNPRHDDVETMDRWHRENGWAGVGYHFYIDKAGYIFHGRDLERVPAAQAPFNRGTIAICLGGLKAARFTSAQFRALNELARAIDDAYGGEMRFRGHKEVAPKACPVFDYKAVLRLDKNGRIMDGVPTVKKLEVSKSENMKEARAEERDGDVAIAVGGGTAATTVVTAAKEAKPLETLKDIASKATDFKSLAVKLGEVMGWLITLEGLMITGGAGLAFFGWRLWRRAKARRANRLKEETKLKRLQREALEAYG